MKNLSFVVFIVSISFFSCKKNSPDDRPGGPSSTALTENADGLNSFEFRKEDPSRFEYDLKEWFLDPSVPYGQSSSTVTKEFVSTTKAHVKKVILWEDENNPPTNVIYDLEIKEDGLYATYPDGSKILRVPKNPNVGDSFQVSLTSGDTASCTIIATKKPMNIGGDDIFCIEIIEKGPMYSIVRENHLFLNYKIGVVKEETAYYYNCGQKFYSRSKNLVSISD